jgi:hypothetical protein
VPLEKSGGAVVADTVVAHRLSCVIDVSEFSEGEKITFLIDFAERLYRTNRDPLHLFLEEADDYVPQRPMREQARLLRAWENIVRRGRARGLGMTMITQRSAALNKNVLTQIETLFVLRTTSPQDRKAVEAWVEYHGQADELLESLSSLQSGDAWVWSPSWLGVMKRIHVHRRSTFDSGATPKQLTGSKPPATLADVDLADVQKKMAATIERAKETDPRELKKKIAELDRQLKAKQAPVADEREIERRIKVRLDDETRNLKQQLATRDARIAELAKVADENLRHIVKELGVKFSPGPAPKARPTIIAHQEKSVGVPRPAAVITPLRPPAARDDNGELPTAAQKILNVLAQYPVGRSRLQAAVMCGYSPNSGGVAAALALLRKRELVTGTDKQLNITEAGRAIAKNEPLPTGEELLEFWMNHPSMTTAAKGFLKQLHAAYPAALSRQELAAAEGYSSTSGGVAAALALLRKIELAEGTDKELRASAAFFE